MTNKNKQIGFSMVLAAAMGIACLLALGGCVSAEAQARESNWHGRVVQSDRALEEGRAQEAADLFIQLWKEKAVSPQPEGGIQPRQLVLRTSLALKNEKVRPLLEQPLRTQLAVLEQRVIDAKADAYETEIWYDLMYALDANDSIVRVVEAGRTNRAILAPLMTPKAQRESLQRKLRSIGRDDVANVLDQTGSEAFTEGMEDALRFGAFLTPGLLATY